MRSKQSRKSSLAIETKIHQMNSIPPESVPEVGEPASYTCSACGGPVEVIQEGTVIRFRCQVGHGFTVHSLLLGRIQKSEEVIWGLVSNFMETSRLSDLLSRQARKEGLDSVAKKFRRVQDQCRELADLFRDSVARLPDATLDEVTSDRKRPT